MGPDNPSHWYANTESNLLLPDKEEGVVLRSCSVDRPIHLIGGRGPACGIEKIGRLGLYEIGVGDAAGDILSNRTCFGRFLTPI